MVKWRIMLGLGFKEFESAKRTITGFEVIRMIYIIGLLKKD